MKRFKGEPPSSRRFKLSYLLWGTTALYVILIFLKFPQFLKRAVVFSGNDFEDGFVGLSNVDDKDVELSKSQSTSMFSDELHRILQNNDNQDPHVRPGEKASQEKEDDHPLTKSMQPLYGRITAEGLIRMNRPNNLTLLERMADEAWALGLRLGKK